MDESVLVTIILPTTSDRGLLLPFSVASVQQQTLRAFELFVIGDGVDESTRAVIVELMRGDSRIHFFDHEKHSRRGEIHRHEALQQARGYFVAYLCDRDLWLPNHLEILAHHLKTASLVATNYYFVRRNQRLVLPYLPVSPRQAVRGILSAAGHRLDFYRMLPHGWRTTPTNRATDLYMWDQMLAHPDCRVAVAWQPTLLYFKRNNHPGWPTQQRFEELTRWSALLQTPDALQPAIDETMADMLYERNRFRRSWLLFRGRRLTELPAWFIGKLRRWLTRPANRKEEENEPPVPIRSAH